MSISDPQTSNRLFVAAPDSTVGVCSDMCVCVCVSTGHRLWLGLCSRSNEKCCASLASLIIKLVTEMDEIMAPRAVWKKYALLLPPLTGNGK